MSQVTIRQATEADRTSVEALWAYCFSDGDTFRHWYFEKYYQTGECLVAQIGETVAASLQVIDLPTRIADKVVPAGYIVGVDCLPEYRGMGLTRRLMDEAVNVYAPSHGLRMLHLMPFEADFYLPYGFVYSDYHFEMDLPIEEFYEAGDRALAHRYHWRDLPFAETAAWLPTLEAMYERCTAGYDICVTRKGLRRWLALVDDVAMEGGYVKLLIDENEQVAGCLAYIMKEGALFVRECLAQDVLARRAIYYFIASHRSQVKRVQWSAPEDERVVFHRKKDKSGVRYQPFMMDLILDPTLIGLLAAQTPAEDLSFTVKGLGSYRWPAQSRQIERLAQIEGPVQVQFDQRSLTEMVFDRAWDAGAVPGSAPLAALFTGKARIFNNEYF